MLAFILILVERIDKTIGGMKNNLFILNQIITLHSASIKQPNTQLGQIFSYLNTMKKGLPSDTIVNLKTHVIAIVTKSGKTLGNDIVNLDKDPNEKGSDEQVTKKRKLLDTSNEKVTIPKVTRVEKPKIVEKKSKNKETLQVIIVTFQNQIKDRMPQSPKSKSLLHFHKGLGKRNMIPTIIKKTKK